MIVSFHDHQSAHPHLRPLIEVSPSPFAKSQTRRFRAQRSGESVLAKFVCLRCVSRLSDLFADLITNEISSTQSTAMTSAANRVAASRP